MPCEVYTPLEEQRHRAEQRGWEEDRQIEWSLYADNLTHMLDEGREELIAGRSMTDEHIATIEQTLERVEEISKKTRGGDFPISHQCQPHATKRLVAETKDVITANKQVAKKGTMLKTVGAKIHKAQEQHRKEDLARVVMHFADEFNFEEVAHVAQCDTTKPLIPQLGYDPDTL